MLAPDRNSFSIRKPMYRLRTSKLNTVILRHGTGKVIITIGMFIDPGISPLFNQGFLYIIQTW